MKTNDEEMLRRLGTNRLDSDALDGPEDLRQAVYARTLRLLRARRLRRQAVRAAAMVAVYFAGAATVLLAGQSREPDIASGPAAESGHWVAAIPATNDESALLDPEKLAITMAPLERPEQARILKRAGDAWLARDDLQTAVKYYRDYLDQLEPERRGRPDADDSWLLMSLRVEHAEENSHETPAT